jgi:hypothetical protein
MWNWEKEKLTIMGLLERASLNQNPEIESRSL